MRRVMRLMLVGLLLLLPAPGNASSQQTAASCPQIVQVALDTTDRMCDALGSNQACYGHVLVDATPQRGIRSLEFDTEGDTAALFEVQALRLSPMDVEVGTWGVVLMKMQAYMQYARPQNVTFILFGDVEVMNSVEPLTTVQVVVSGKEYVNARLAPSLDAGVIETLPPGQSLIARGRLADNSWLRVVLPQSGRVGWVHGSVLAAVGDVDDLNVVDPWSPYYGPMQAFYFRSGVEDAFCPESPDSGILIQTPEGVAEVTLLVNEVSISLSATAYLQAERQGNMTVSILDGWADVEAEGMEQRVFAGTQVSIPLDENLSPVAHPSLPAPYDYEDMLRVPTMLLEEWVEVTEALEESALNSLLALLAQSESDGGASTSAETESTEETMTSPPGLEGVLPPGMDDNPPPGQGGVPPGQDDQPPPGQAKKN